MGHCLARGNIRVATLIRAAAPTRQTTASTRRGGRTHPGGSTTAPIWVEKTGTVDAEGRPLRAHAPERGVCRACAARWRPSRHRARPHGEQAADHSPPRERRAGTPPPVGEGWGGPESPSGGHKGPRVSFSGGHKPGKARHTHSPSTHSFAGCNADRRKVPGPCGRLTHARAPGAHSARPPGQRANRRRSPGHGGKSVTIRRCVLSYPHQT